MSRCGMTAREANVQVFVPGVCTPRIGFPAEVMFFAKTASTPAPVPSVAVTVMLTVCSGLFVYRGGGAVIVMIGGVRSTFTTTGAERQLKTTSHAVYCSVTCPSDCPVGMVQEPEKMGAVAPFTTPSESSTMLATAFASVASA